MSKEQTIFMMMYVAELIGGFFLLAVLAVCAALGFVTVVRAFK